MLRALWPAFRLWLVLTVLTGVVYPLTVTLLARTLFAHQAGGSLLHDGAAVVGSEHVGQSFSDPAYFWSRPSASSVPYDAAASGGSNRGPLDAQWRTDVQARIAALRASGIADSVTLPADLVMASGSGLDPEISPAAADVQVARVAAARGLDAARVRALVQRHTQGRTFGVLGEPRVHVLALNRELDTAAPRHAGVRSQ